LISSHSNWNCPSFNAAPLGPFYEFRENPNRLVPCDGRGKPTQNRCLGEEPETS
jgi:hypothetical protein